ncbi:MAG: M20/M25/M40 family metallo-hydrolase [Gemmatimonadota bacterium]
MLGALLLVALATVAPALASSEELWVVRWTAPGQLEAALDRGLRIRFVGSGVALVSGAAPAAAAASLEVVARDQDGAGESYYLADDLHLPLPEGAVLVYRSAAGWSLLRVREAQLRAILDAQPFLYPLPDSYSLAGLRLRPVPRPVATLGAAAVEELVAQVDVGRVRGHVRSLALLDTAAGSTYDNLRSRFCLRADTRAATEYIRDHLAASLGPAAVEVQQFSVAIPTISAQVQDLSAADDLTMYNVVGELDGTDPEAGYYVVCAHYDAIGLRTPGHWDWRTDPAPGADDNATGVAVVLETARVLSQVRLPWTVRFCLWSGEELGLRGSRAYAEAARGRDDRILGVLNVDMVGYNWRRQRVQLVTNPASEWLVALMSEAEERYGLGLQVDVLHDAYATLSDHGPFWARGYDGVLAIENYLPSDSLSAGPVTGDYVPYAAYHSAADVPDSVNWELVGRVARLWVATLGQYADPGGLPDLAVFTGDLVGDAADDLRVHVANLGRAPVDGPVRVRVWRCGADSTGCEVIHDGDAYLHLAPGGMADLTVPWQRYGETVFLVEVDPDGLITEADETDNRAFQNVRLVPSSSVAVYPNPFRPDRDPYLSFNGLPLFSRVRIATAAGELVWVGREEEQGDLSREVRWRGTNAAGYAVGSGIYLYTVDSFGGQVLRRDKVAVIR